MRPGIFARGGDVQELLGDLGAGTKYVLDEQGTDVRAEALADDATFFVGDQLGFDDATRAELNRLGCVRLSLGPTSLHSEDAIAVLSNELDRRAKPS
jgi:tRNA (pseudouridine54-N1)-methyltransferase